MRGVLVGAVTYNGEPMVGLSMGQETVVINPEYALIIFNQLGHILDQMGMLEDDDPEDEGVRH